LSLESRKIRLLLELRRGGVTDTRVLAAIEKVPRELFVAQPFRDRAYANTTLPIGKHQTISQPLVVGQMTQALDVTDRMKVLEIGTGSGYQAAVLAPLCRRLYTIERYKDLLREAEARFAELGITNIVTITGDGSKGWPEQAPFDRIIVTAAAADVPPVLVDQLAVGGIMVVPVGHGTAEEDQRLLKVTRTQDGAEVEDLGVARFVPFVAADEEDV
jgi:protein-L-isoaspartate(D-aspartate) O-methyltransferase